MKRRKSWKEFQKSKVVLVLSVQVLQGEVEWVAGGCSLENSILTSKLSKPATQLQKYIGTLNVLDNFCVVDRFDKDGSAWVDVYTTQSNRELMDEDSEIIAMRRKIQHLIEQHVEIIMKIASHNSKSATHVPGGNASVEALARLLTNRTDMKIKFDFQDQGIKTVETIKPFESKIYSDDKVVASGWVKNFNESDQNVTLFKMQNSGKQVVLSVGSPGHRESLIDAQKVSQNVTVQFNPTVDLLRPDKSVSGGILVEILKTGAP